MVEGMLINGYVWRNPVRGFASENSIWLDVSGRGIQQQWNHFRIHSMKYVEDINASRAAN